jgi:large subunit ribosomal protein L22
MTGPKTNETATRVGERVGTRASVRYVRVSAYKAREVLDLIRGLDVKSADEVLQFTERDVAIIVRKCLASAVANAQNNDAQDPDELKVVACYADEGPTLKRFRPRARGRAGRIRKRTSHITIIVGRMTELELEIKRRKEESQPAARRGRGPGRAAQARRERVARSRQAAAAAKGQAPVPATEEPVEEPEVDEVELDETDQVVETDGAEDTDDSVAEAADAEGVVDETAGIAEDVEDAEATETGEQEDEV